MLVLSPQVFVTEKRSTLTNRYPKEGFSHGCVIPAPPRRRVHATQEKGVYALDEGAVILTKAAHSEPGGAGAGGGAAEPVAVRRAVTGAVVARARRAGVVLEAHDGE